MTKNNQRTHPVFLNREPQKTKNFDLLDRFVGQRKRWTSIFSQRNF